MADRESTAPSEAHKTLWPLAAGALVMSMIALHLAVSLDRSGASVRPDRHERFEAALVR